jgi:regulator of replication initiation timing
LNRTPLFAAGLFVLLFLVAGRTEAYRVEMGEPIGVGQLVERVYLTDCSPCRSLTNKVNRLERQITKKYREQARLRQQRDQIRSELRKVWDELDRLRDGQSINLRSQAQVQDVVKQLEAGGDPGALADAVKRLKELRNEELELQRRINQAWFKREELFYQLARLDERISQIDSEIGSLRSEQYKLLAKVEECERKYCGDLGTDKTLAPPAEPTPPLKETPPGVEAPSPSGVPGVPAGGVQPASRPQPTGQMGGTAPPPPAEKDAATESSRAGDQPPGTPAIPKYGRAQYGVFIDFFNVDWNDPAAARGRSFAASVGGGFNKSKDDGGTIIGFSYLYGPPEEEHTLPPWLRKGRFGFQIGVLGSALDSRHDVPYQLGGNSIHNVAESELDGWIIRGIVEYPVAKPSPDSEMVVGASVTRWLADLDTTLTQFVNGVPVARRTETDDMDDWSYGVSVGGRVAMGNGWNLYGKVGAEFSALGGDGYSISFIAGYDLDSLSRLLGALAGP